MYAVCVCVYQMWWSCHQVPEVSLKQNADVNMIIDFSSDIRSERVDVKRLKRSSSASSSHSSYSSYSRNRSGSRSYSTSRSSSASHSRASSRSSSYSRSRSGSYTHSSVSGSLSSLRSRSRSPVSRTISKKSHVPGSSYHQEKVEQLYRRNDTDRHRARPASPTFVEHQSSSSYREYRTRSPARPGGRDFYPLEEGRMEDRASRRVKAAPVSNNYYRTGDSRPKHSSTFFPKPPQFSNYQDNNDAYMKSSSRHHQQRFLPPHAPTSSFHHPSPHSSRQRQEQSHLPRERRVVRHSPLPPPAPPSRDDNYYYQASSSRSRGPSIHQPYVRSPQQAKPSSRFNQKSGSFRSPERAMNRSRDMQVNTSRGDSKYERRREDVGSGRGYVERKGERREERDVRKGNGNQRPNGNPTQPPTHHHHSRSSAGQYDTVHRISKRRHEHYPVESSSVPNSQWRSCRERKRETSSPVVLSVLDSVRLDKVQLSCCTWFICNFLCLLP